MASDDVDFTLASNAFDFIADRETWQRGEIMIKFVMCIKRRADLSREEFMDYWQNKHGPFFMEKSHVMKAKKYVQSQTISSPLNQGLKESRGMMDEFDGVAEVWFESEQSLIEAMGSAEMEALHGQLLADEKNFIDHEGSAAFIVREVEF